MHFTIYVSEEEEKPAMDMGEAENRRASSTPSEDDVSGSRGPQLWQMLLVDQIRWHLRSSP
jgi:hypothetical protein